jgi:hypothetical protein
LKGCFNSDKYDRKIKGMITNRMACEIDLTDAKQKKSGVKSGSAFCTISIN